METPSCYVSTAHPGPVTASWAYARSFVRPFTLCVLPVMIAALMDVLQGFPALIYLTTGLPGAALVAAAWTLFRLQATPAEICVLPGSASVRTIWECVRARPRRWLPILDLRITAATLTVGLGDAAYELNRETWPEAEALLEALRVAREAGFLP